MENCLYEGDSTNKQPDLDSQDFHSVFGYHIKTYVQN